MSREIKYRAWNGYLGKMFYGSDVHLTYKYDAIVSESYDNNGKCFEMQLMQYTGLKDKSGIEIYEGDIVYASGKGNWPVDFLDTLSSMTIYDIRGDEEDFEVIGNIYENQELLQD